MAPGHRLPTTASQVLARSRSAYVCQSCRNRLQTTPVPNASQIRHSTGSPFLDKLRKKIWGTENPPGQANPYGPTWHERQKTKQEQQQRQHLNQEELAEEDAESAQDERQSPQNVFHRQSEKIEDDEPSEDDPSPQEYKPAETWDGLEHVGHKGNWKDVEPTQADSYEPWMPPKSELAWSREDLVQCLHRAVVENTPSSVESRKILPRYYSTQGPSNFIIALAEDRALKTVEEVKPVQEKHSKTDSVQTSDDIDQVEELDEEGLEALAEDDILTERKTGEVYSVDETFLTAKLDFTTQQAFKILKRFQQLTSHRLRDPIINSLMQQPEPFASLIEHVLDLQRPRPKNLYERLMEKESLQSYSNLMILPRRETPVDKEKEVGRWKVIEKELKERGLPVLGRLETSQQ